MKTTNSALERTVKHIGHQPEAESRMLGRRLIVLLAALAVSQPFADDRLSSEARELLAKANGGDAKAQFILGAAYDSGRGAPRDASEAMKWYRASANQGYAKAQNSLGSALQGEKKFADAISWYEKASAQGYALATNNLAYLYDLGLGVPQDRRKGFELYSKAANLGVAEAMWNLANMYGAGQLGKEDLLMACVWTLRAKRFAAPDEEQLHAHVARVLPRLEKKLSAEAFANCKERGDAWKPSVLGN
jgi:uncharacterized protein